MSDIYQTVQARFIPFIGFNTEKKHVVTWYQQTPGLNLTDASDFEY